MDWILCYSKIHMLKANPQCDGIWRWDLWKVIHGSHMNGISAPVRRDTKDPSLLKSQWRSSCLKAGSGFSVDSVSASTLILNFPASITLRNKCLWLIHPVSAIFVKAAWNKTVEEEEEKYVIGLATITGKCGFLKNWSIVNVNSALLVVQKSISVIYQYR